jgi:CRP-like cAMP-binding protein
MPSTSTHPNQVLAALQPGDFARLQPHLRPLTLALRDDLEFPNQPIGRVVFPVSGLLSLIAHQGEYQLEVGIVGRDGMTGTALLLGAEAPSQQCFVQVAGEGVSVETGEFKRALTDRPTLHASFLRYVHALLMQTAQTALANGRCTITERLARWLLMSQDRLGGNEVPLTHEFLSLMLGVRRSGVTEALHILERKGAIGNRRGLITVLRRRKLEDLAAGASRPLPA